MNDTSTAAYRLLSLTALSGECSPDILSRLGIGPSYGEKLVTKLKDEGLLKTHYKDRLRGYRLACGGKKLLLAQNPERFSFYLSGNTETNHPRSGYPRRLRLQQASHIYAMLLNAGITFFRDEKPLIFREEPQAGESVRMPLPIFYHLKW